MIERNSLSGIDFDARDEALYNAYKRAARP
jgi:hypothetical protein